MACTHAVTKTVLSRLGGGGPIRNTALMIAPAAKLMKAFASQAEVLRRAKKRRFSVVRVAHVQVNGGGQAVIGNVVRHPRGTGPER